jgi:UDP-N-acetylmuramoyl-L-alanyl-D-glutamate--2,6-diaminopimelate ligase
MRLKHLMAGVELRKWMGPQEVEIGSVHCDSREVKPNSLFVAIKGTRADGHDYIPQAISMGAEAIVLEDELRLKGKGGVSWLLVENSRKALAIIASNFYGNPASKMTIIGITGTNGKTTTSFLIDSIFRNARFPAGLIGTIEIRYGQERFPSQITTPESIEIHRILRDMLEKGITHCVMEVSSHSLDMYRVWGLKFSCAVFTNLSRDHLDYHKTIDSYLKCKMRLFTEEGTGTPPEWAIINVDDPSSNRIMAIARAPVIGYGIRNRAHIWASEIRYSEEGLSAIIHTPKGDFEISSSLLGEINLYNILAATCVGLSQKIDIPIIKKGLEEPIEIPGRLQRVPNEEGIVVLIDYAHTGDALERILKTARELTKGRVITLFGCGGDRDRGKRPLMGQIGARYSDILIITSDNPRSESPIKIIDEIEQGVRDEEIKKVGVCDIFSVNGRVYTIVVDRREAIRVAIATSRPGDVVIIAGKGHEDYQIIGGEKIHFSDFEEAKIALETYKKKPWQNSNTVFQ